MKGIVGFIRAVINAPEMKHWIDKYEAAKRDNDRLRRELEDLRRSEKPRGSVDHAA